MLGEKLDDIKEFIKSYIETYQTCINTKNPDFLLQLVKSSPEIQETYVSTHLENMLNDSDETNIVLKKKEQISMQLFKQMLTGLNDLDESMETSKQVQMHRNLTLCYFEFTKKNIRDFVPKRIQHKMVNLVLDDFENHLIEFVFTPYLINQSFDKVLVEADGVIEDREQAEKLLNAVNKALKNMVDIQCY